MNVFELAAKLTLDTSEYEKGLKKTGEEIKGFSNEAEGAEGKASKFGNAMKKGLATAAKVAGAALAAAGTAVIAITKKATEAAGELEQNMGGSEAVFKSYAANMQEIAKGAYREMGLSASDFLATANKMGALMQGSGLGIRESAEISAKAMQRAADVASIMGIDVSMAMESIAGAAKGNFTMMDNLGVAMNATTIEAYALSKGIDQSFNEMDNATKVSLAMEMFLEKTAYATGNYAKENETLAGSLTTAKAAWDNFLSGAGGVDELADSVIDAAGVITKNLTEILPKIVDGLSSLAEKLIPEIPPVLEKLLPAVITGAVGILTGIVDALPELIGIITDMLPTVIDLIFGEAIPAILEAIPTLISTLVDGIVAAVPALLEGIVLLIEALIANLPAIIDAIIVAIPMITEAVNNALIENLPKIIEGLILLVLGIVERLPDIIQALVAEIPNIVSTLVQVILENLPLIIWGITELVWGIVKSLPEILQTIWDSLFNWIDGLVQGVKDVQPKFKEAAELWGDKLLEGLKEKWDAVKQWASDMWSSVQEWFKGLKDQFLGIGEDLLNGLWDGLRNIWNQVSTWFTEAWDGLVGKAKSILGIKSPSRVFASIGEMVAKGFEVGFENEFLTVEKNMSNAFDNLAPDPFEITAAGNVTASSGSAYGKSVTVTQNIYAERMTPAQAFREAITAQERAVFMGV